MREWYGIWLICWLLWLPLQAQDATTLRQQAKAQLAGGQFDQAIQAAQQAVALAQKAKDPVLHGQSLLVLGQAQQAAGKWAEAVNNLLQAASLLENQPDKSLLAENYTGLGEVYFASKAYDKAATYLAKAAALNPSPPNLYALGEAYTRAKNTAKAQETFQQLLITARQQQKSNYEDQALSRLAVLAENAGQWEKAIGYENERLTAARQHSDKAAEAAAHNNLGYLYKKNNRLNDAAEHFRQALNLLKNIAQTNKNALVLNNLGVTYSNLADYRSALAQHTAALRIAEEQQDTKGIADAYNHIGACQYINANSGGAIANAEKALSLAESIGDNERMMESCQILTEAHQRDGNYTEAKRYADLYQRLKEQQDAALRKMDEEALQNTLQAEKTEGELKMLIADREKQELALNQLKLEAEKRDQELALLRRDGELKEAQRKAEKLERERVAQALALAKGQLEAEKNKQRIAELERQREIAELEKQRRELEEKDKQQQIERLEAEKRFKEAEMARQQEAEATYRRFTYWIFGLGIAILIGIIYGFFSKMKAARIFRRQAEEIRSKNTELLHTNNQLQVTEEELRQNMEELETTQEQLRTQNLTLEKTFIELQDKNKHITDSIRYAQTIQAAILPAKLLLDQAFASHFVLYMPKDVVSGDFYWMSQLPDRTCIAVVDCTGHGVPGAFMSMIGFSLLNQIVNEKDITDPGRVLPMLNANVVHALRQHDRTDANGMDLAFCTIEKQPDGRFKLLFSGAKSKMLYIHKGELHELAATHASIGRTRHAGGDENPHRFDMHEVMLEKGDQLYLFTDGIIDTANTERKRLGTQKLREWLQTHSHLPMDQQGGELQVMLSEYQGKAEQRDDVTVLGVKL